MRFSRHEERGMVTAELAACLPVLVVVLAVAVSAVSVAGVRVRAQDAAREAARAAARGDPGQARQLPQQAAPGVVVDITNSGEEIVAVARITVHPLASWLPALTVSERAVAAVEPSAASP
jgi:Flp pilus assembly protein TadG